MLARSVRAVGIIALLVAAAPAAGADVVLPTPPPPVLSKAARAAAATVDAFHAALRRGDTKAALALLADDALVFEEGRAERSKAEYAAHHVGADAEFSKAVPGERTHGRGDAAGDIAWIATEGRTKGTFRGRAVNRVTDETMVLRRIRGTWKIVHIHWSSAEASVE